MLSAESMSGLWFGWVCGSLSLTAVVLFAVLALDQRRKYLPFLALAPVMGGLGLAAQVFPGLGIGWRVGFSELILAAGALLTFEGLARRTGRGLGCGYHIGFTLSAGMVILVAEVIFRSPIWTLHLGDVVLAGIGVVAVFRLYSRWPEGAWRRLLLADVVLFQIVLVGRSWVGLNVTALSSPIRFPLGVWSDWVYIAFSLLSVGLGALIVYAEVGDVVGRLVRERDVDPLTGLLNRRGFEAAVRVQMRDESHSCAMILSDLDHFKRVNDALGHPGGDQVLQEYAALIRGEVRDGVLGRIGGEEFAVFLRDATAETARDAAEVLRGALESRLFGTRPGQLRVTVSNGIAVGGPGVTYGDLVLVADKCLYRAKAAGRNQTWNEIPVLS